MIGMLRGLRICAPRLCCQHLRKQFEWTATTVGKADWPDAQSLNIAGAETPQRQRGGRQIALQIFDEF